ncbi:MAG: FkbM family methyltransferase [Limisphaerales bacterium]
MKLKEVFYGLGLRPPAREYSFELDSFVLPREGEVFFARWRHPKEHRKEFSQEAVDALRGFLAPGDVAIDIGAHTGDTALEVALAVGPQGAVLALEPNPFTYKVLIANAGLNRKKTNIYPLMFAATPQDGEFEFQYSDSGYCNGGLHEGIGQWRHAHFFGIRVRGRNLLNYLKAEFPSELARVRYIKIDTEGFDRSVAASLRELLVKNRPFIRSEIYQHLGAEPRQGYYRDLRELGYRVHRFNSEVDYTGPELGLEEMTRWEHFDIFAVPE